MSTVTQIAKGMINNLLDKEDDLYQQRIKICRDCKLLKHDRIFGEVCNSSLYMNKDNEISNVPKPGFKSGCGCMLGSKCRVKEARCPLEKW